MGGSSLDTTKAADGRTMPLHVFRLMLCDWAALLPAEIVAMPNNPERSYGLLRSQFKTLTDIPKANDF
jgi:hypothetical protein